MYFCEYKITHYFDDTLLHMPLLHDISLSATNAAPMKNL